MLLHNRFMVWTLPVAITVNFVFFLLRWLDVEFAYMLPAALAIYLIAFMCIVVGYIKPLRPAPGFDGSYCKHCGFDVREQVRAGDSVCPECAKPLPPKGHLVVKRLGAGGEAQEM
jgi:hypothetical protein